MEYGQCVIVSEKHLAQRWRRFSITALAFIWSPFQMNISLNNKYISMNNISIKLQLKLHWRDKMNTRYIYLLE